VCYFRGGIRTKTLRRIYEAIKRDTAQENKIQNSLDLSFSTPENATQSISTPKSITSSQTENLRCVEYTRSITSAVQASHRFSFFFS
jgi:hypothetical protein